MHIPNDSQTDKLLGVINLKSPFGVRDHRMIQLARHTGLRVSELSHLNIGHVTRRGQPREELDLPAPLAKRRKARVIPLNAIAKQAIADLLAFNQARGLSIDPDAPLLQNRHHRRISVRAIQRAVAYYREVAELDVKVTPHSMRHLFATNVLRETNNIRLVQILLGHFDIRTTERYTHPGLDELKKAMKAIERHPALR